MKPLFVITAIMLFILGIYIGCDRYGRADVEYQFVVTDDSLTVFDKDRVVGTVKLEGQLDSLIINDNQ